MILEPGLDLGLISGREIGQDVVSVGFTAFDIDDVCIHIPVIIKQSIGRRVARVRRKFGNFLTTERGRRGGDFYRGGRGEHGLGGRRGTFGEDDKACCDVIGIQPDMAGRGSCQGFGVRTGWLV